MNETCVLCHLWDFNIDKDYKMCYNCFYYYEEHNPNIIEDFENGLITNNIILIDEQYNFLSCVCSNSFKFYDNIKVKYYKKLFYNRKYQLEKYIKNMRIIKILIEWR